MVVTTIEDFGRSYLINNPEVGRVGSKLNLGVPYERKLLTNVYSQNFTGSAFDIGAHIGNHSLYLAAICGLKVYAWEPHEDSRVQLERNIDLNPQLDITIYGWAAGDRHTRGRFTSGMWLEFDPEREGDKIKLDRGHVQVHPIDEMVEVTDLSIVKIDVEGMEADVLRGMVNHLEANKPTIYTEAHTDDDIRKIRSVIGPLGFSITAYLHMGSRQIRWTHTSKQK